jgi:hypothetical protein
MTTENPGQRDHLDAGKPAPDLDDRLDAFSPRIVRSDGAAALWSGLLVRAARSVRL